MSKQNSEQDVPVEVLVNLVLLFPLGLISSTMACWLNQGYLVALEFIARIVGNTRALRSQ